MVILALFIEVFGVIYRRPFNMKERLCTYGCLIPCTAYYMFRKLKTKLMEPKAVS